MAKSQSAQGDAGWLGLTLMFLGVWAFANLFYVYFHQTPVLDLRLVDTDSYMRLVRVGAFLDHGGWWNSDIARSNWPAGETLHWTRPFDVLLLLLRGPLTLFMPGPEALYWAGVVISPLLQLVLAAAFFWAFRPFAGQFGLVLATIALILQPAVLNYLQPGRADHHGLLLVTFALGLGCGVRAMISPAITRWALLAGALSGFGLWLSVELTVLMAALAIATAGVWLLAPRLYLRSGLAFGLGLVFVTALAVLLEQPTDQFLRVEYDKVSFAQLMVTVLVLGFWVLVAAPLRAIKADDRLWARLAGAVLWGGLALGGLYRAFPGLFQGHYATIEPALIELWFGNVNELKPLIPKDAKSLGRLVTFLGLGVLAIPALAYQTWQARHRPIGFAWCLLAIATLAYSGLALWSVRLSPFAEILYIGVLAGPLHNISEKIEAMSLTLLRSLCRAALILVLIAAAPLLGDKIGEWGQTGGDLAGATAAAEKPKSALAKCDVRAFSQWLNQQAALTDGNQPQTILAFIDLAPELLYRTPHRVIATPYHRNSEGFWDGYNSMATDDLAEAQAIMTKREVDLILLCPDSPERPFLTGKSESEAVYNQVLNGPRPEWITPVPLPEGLNEFRLYQVAL